MRELATISSPTPIRGRPVVARPNPGVLRVDLVASVAATASLEVQELPADGPVSDRSADIADRYFEQRVALFKDWTILSAS